jgi:hypothetical protein
MTSQEYTQWLKGFLDAVDGYNITKKQFDTIREKLKEVNDTVGTPISNGWGIPNWGGNIINTPATTPYSIPLTGTISTASGYPSGSTITYTTANRNGTTYTIPANTFTSATAVYANQSDEDDEKLLLD